METTLVSLIVFCVVVWFVAIGALIARWLPGEGE